MKVGERANAELTGDTLEEARSLLELLRAERVIDTQTYRRRLDQISCAVVRRGIAMAWDPGLRQRKDGR